jgi:thiamine-monophosphate kinase
MVAGVHFQEDDPPELVGGKLLRVNLSDLAAMGADPLAYLTVIARPPALGTEWLEAFARGLAADQARVGLHLIGGDTVTTPGPLLLSLTIVGSVPTGTTLRRDGARPGDLVLVSGTLGDAAAGLRVLRGLATTEEAALALIDRYRTPRPRLALGRALRGLASAAIDVSDGFLADLGHVLTASCVGAVIEAERLPLSEAAHEVPDALSSALSGGDDYELVATLPERHGGEVDRLVRALGLRLTVVGRIRAEPGLELRDASGRPLPVAHAGWTHF